MPHEQQSDLLPEDGRDRALDHSGREERLTVDPCTNSPFTNDIFGDRLLDADREGLATTQATA